MQLFAHMQFDAKMQGALFGKKKKNEKESEILKQKKMFD